MLDRARMSAERAGLGAGEWAVDLGGGYGAHAEAWVPLGLRPLVIEPERSMSIRALRRPGVAVVGGRGEQLPLRDGTIGLLYAHLSIHYCDWRRALDEALRVLRAGGSLSVWTLGPRHHVSSFLSRWFPGIAEDDARRFPDPALLAGHLADRGAFEVEIVPVDAEIRRSARAYATAIRARFVSSLQLITDDEFARGVAAFLAAHPDGDEVVAYTLRYDWVRARA